MNDYIHFSIKRLCFIRSSFHSKRNTIDALAEISKQIRQGSTDTFTCILLNLGGAFDSINHDVLLAKIEKYAVKGIRINWFESFLKEQRQCVQVNDVVPDSLYLLVGLRQGSFIGPLEFLMYINELPCACEFLYSIYFLLST